MMHLLFVVRCLHLYYQRASKMVCHSFPLPHLISKCLLLSFLCLWGDVSGNGFNGKRLMVAAETWKPWVLISKEAGEMKYSGIMLKVLEFLQESLNFTITMARPPDGEWGVLDSSGNWSGMVGMLKRNEVDIALGR